MVLQCRLIMLVCVFLVSARKLKIYNKCQEVVGMDVRKKAEAHLKMGSTE